MLQQERQEQAPAGGRTDRRSWAQSGKLLPQPSTIEEPNMTPGNRHMTVVSAHILATGKESYTVALWFVSLEERDIGIGAEDILVGGSTWFSAVCSRVYMDGSDHRGRTSSAGGDGSLEEPVVLAE